MMPECYPARKTSSQLLIDKTTYTNTTRRCSTLDNVDLRYNTIIIIIIVDINVMTILMMMMMMMITMITVTIIILSVNNSLHSQ